MHIVCWRLHPFLSNREGYVTKQARMIMKSKSEKSIQLYRFMMKRGYPEPFCDEVTTLLNTDWTAQRMLGYLSHYQKLKLEDVADEVLAILSDRDRIMDKKETEAANAKWNQMMWNGFPFGEDD